MGPSRVTKMDGQIRVVRVTKAAIKHPMEGPDSPIRSSVDSWLSSIPSVKKPKSRKAQVKPITQPPVTKSPPNRTFRTTCMIFAGVVFTILLLCTIIGIVLAVKLQPSTESGSQSTAAHFP